LFPSCSLSIRGPLAFVGPAAGCALALLTACAPTASSVVSAKPALRLAAASASSAPVAHGDTELGKLLDSGPELTVAGERVNIALLRRFYARHRFAPVWTDRQKQADALTDAVTHAGDYGLSGERFHANVLHSSETLPSLDRELLLSDAFLSYADALARGVMPIEHRPDDQALAPEPVDVTATLDAAIDDPDPAAALEALAPATPTYRLLRLALQNVHTDNPVGGRTATNRLREIAVNLERERWLPRRLPPDRVWVNVADERLVLYRDDRPVFTTKVIVGQDERRNQSPEFQTMIKGITFNPPWNIPEDIATNEILPKANGDPDYLEKHNMVRLPNGVLQQRAGPNGALGHFLFDMQNRFDVYLHDTPSKDLFTRDNRRISHGCIRVENMRELAALLMKQSVEDIDQTTATGETTDKNLPEPVPVFVVYQTAFADADGKLQFRPDAYGRDAQVWQYLDTERRAVADRDAPGQRGG
jgi:murein L,D-transpeptidase YcbB/YkuD